MQELEPIIILQITYILALHLPMCTIHLDELSDPPRLTPPQLKIWMDYEITSSKIQWCKSCSSLGDPCHLKHFLSPALYITDVVHNFLSVSSCFATVCCHLNFFLVSLCLSGNTNIRIFYLFWLLKWNFFFKWPKPNSTPISNPVTTR